MTKAPPASALFERIGALSLGTDRQPITRAVVEEVPVGLVYNGFPHAVMMASPGDFEDLALGFSVAEGIAITADDVRAIGVSETTEGIEIAVELAGPSFARFLERRRARAMERSMVGRVGCGLCGIERVEDAVRAMPCLPPGPIIDRPAILRALAALPADQALNAETRAAHAAAWADLDGRILLLREDVGRHTALDKLIGAWVKAALDPAAGFCVITSRCSYEMVQKTVACGMRVLVAISAPTALAVRKAEAAGLTLVALARGDAQLVFTGAGRIAPS